MRRGLDPLAARRLALLSRGRPGWAVKADPAALEADVEALTGYLVALCEGDLYRGLASAGYVTREVEGEEREGRARRTAASLEHLVLLLRDAAMAAAGVPGEPALADGRTELERAAARAGADRLLEAAERVRRTAERIPRNVDLRLLVEALTLELEALLAGRREVSHVA
jgi:hypothetical protein